MKSEYTSGIAEGVAQGKCDGRHPKPRVALVRCDSYDENEVTASLQKAFDLLGGLKSLLESSRALRIPQDSHGSDDDSSGREEPVGAEKASNVPFLNSESLLVLKPNLLARSSPDRACTTHPVVFKAVGKLLREAGFNNLKYGDSPGNPVIRPEKVAEECGIKAVTDELDIPIGDFEHGDEVAYPDGRAASSFVLCREILNTDGIINVCKMKTHQLERITGAVKNTFGCVYGINKGASHAKFATAEVFAKMIADLNNLVRPALHVMDGILAMEGNGPQSGTPTEMRVLLVSQDPVALDAVFCHLVDLRPELVPTNVSGMEQGVGSFEGVEVVTEDGVLTMREAAQKYGNPGFNVQRGSEYRGMLRPIRFLAPLLEKKPIVKSDRCVGCGICVRACPVDGKAIEVRDGKAVYDYSRCIKCYCCQEMCPEEAITVRKSLLARIADRKWRI